MMTTAEYHAHRDFMAKRDAIIATAKDQPATHQTACKTWHGCDIAEGTPLIASAELQALFAVPRRANEAETQWFIIANGHGHICQLWLHEFTAKK
jgi:hypothetical protein